MEERQVSVEGSPRPLPDPFLVAATQNPIEYEGTYPLPEAQLDRFLLKLTVPLPGARRGDRDPGPARRRLRPARPGAPPGSGRSPARPTWRPAGRPCARVRVAPEVTGYIVDLCRATRQSPSLQLGVSPRGATALLATSRAWAWLAGPRLRHPDDVKALARPGAAAPGRSCGRRPSSRAPRPTACSTACSPPSRCPGDPRWRSPAVPALAGADRRPWCVAGGVRTLAARCWPSTALLLAAIVADLALAARVRRAAAVTGPATPRSGSARACRVTLTSPTPAAGRCAPGPRRLAAQRRRGPAPRAASGVRRRRPGQR